MLFRPRIFISSTFNGNEKTRPRIERVFNSSGAESLLYEKNLTPSTSPLTYRKNILDADFVILILKDYYGSETDSGLSGTHEEYRIAKAKKIPTHVYLLNSDQEPSQQLKSFINEINDDNVSYYYFKSETQLIKRIRETVFTIAKEIMLNSITNLELSDEEINKLILNKDYQTAIRIFKIINKALEYNNYFEVDFTSTTLFMEMHEEIDFEFAKKGTVFIDSKFDNEFLELHALGKSIVNNICNFSVRGTQLGKISFSDEQKILSRSKYTDSDEYNIVEKDIHKYFDTYKELRKRVAENKVFGDTKY